jgi:hypothetical protein
MTVGNAAALVLAGILAAVLGLGWAIGLGVIIGSVLLAARFLGGDRDS